MNNKYSFRIISVVFQCVPDIAKEIIILKMICRISADSNLAGCPFVCFILFAKSGSIWRMFCEMLRIEMLEQLADGGG